MLDVTAAVKQKVGAAEEAAQTALLSRDVNGRVRSRRPGTTQNFAQFCSAMRAADAGQLGTKVCSLNIVTTI